MLVSGVRSSCVTEAKNACMLRARRCSRQYSHASSSDTASSSASKVLDSPISISRVRDHCAAARSVAAAPQRLELRRCAAPGARSRVAHHTTSASCSASHSTAAAAISAVRRIGAMLRPPWPALRIHSPARDATAPVAETRRRFCTPRAPQVFVGLARTAGVVHRRRRTRALPAIELGAAVTSSSGWHRPAGAPRRIAAPASVGSR